jgi:hypothetical protein
MSAVPKEFEASMEVEEKHADTAVSNGKESVATPATDEPGRAASDGAIVVHDDGKDDQDVNEAEGMLKMIAPRAETRVKYARKDILLAFSRLANSTGGVPLAPTSGLGADSPFGPYNAYGNIVDLTRMHEKSKGTIAVRSGKVVLTKITRAQKVGISSWHQMHESSLSRASPLVHVRRAHLLLNGGRASGHVVRVVQRAVGRVRVHFEHPYVAMVRTYQRTQLVGGLLHGLCNLRVHANDEPVLGRRAHSKPQCTEPPSRAPRWGCAA